MRPMRWYRDRGMRAGRLWGGLLLGMCAASPGVARGAPTVRFADLVRPGAILSGEPFEAGVEVSAPEAFRGRLDAEVRLSYFWKGERFQGSALNALRASAELDIAAGAVQRTRLWFPAQLLAESRGDSREVTLDWVLRDAADRVVDRRREIIEPTFWHGRVVMRYPALPKVRERFVPLGLTLAAPPPRPPERVAVDDQGPQVVVAAPAVRTWSSSAQQALFDSVALGRVVLLTDAADLTLLPAPLRQALSAPDAVIWRGADGAELREIVHLRGILRTTTRSGAAAPFEPWIETDPLLQLGLAVVPTELSWELELVGPAGRGPDKGRREGPGHGPTLRGADAGQSPADAWLERQIERFRLETLVPLSVALGFLVVMWRASRAERPASRRAIRGVLPALIIALLVAPGIALISPATALEGVWVTSYHDAQGTGSLERTVVVRGGGGRSQPPITVAEDPRALLQARRLWSLDYSAEVASDAIHATRTADGKQRIAVDRPGLSAGRILTTQRMRISEYAPPLLARLRVEAGQLVGELRARRALASALLVHPGGAVWLGPLRQGEAVDLAQMKLGTAEAPIELSADMLRLFRRAAIEPRAEWRWDAPPDADEWVSTIAGFGTCFGRDRSRLCPVPWSVLAEEDAPSIVEGFSEAGRPLKAQRVHVQRLAVAELPETIHYRVPSGNRDAWKLSRALSERHGGAYALTALVEDHCEYPVGPAATERGTLALGAEHDGFIEASLRPPLCDADGDVLLRFARKKP